MELWQIMEEVLAVCLLSDVGGQRYPTNTSKVEGYVPDSDTMSSTCSVGNDGQAYWNNGILDCVLGNENSTAFGQT